MVEVLFCWNEWQPIHSFYPIHWLYCWKYFYEKKKRRSLSIALLLNDFTLLNRKEALNRWAFARHFEHIFVITIQCLRQMKWKCQSNHKSFKNNIVSTKKKKKLFFMNRKILHVLSGLIPRRLFSFNQITHDSNFFFHSFASTCACTVHTINVCTNVQRVYNTIYLLASQFVLVHWANLT